MQAEKGVAKTIEQELLEYLKQTPTAIAVLVMSYFSGHLWVFVVTAFLRSKTRGDNLLRSITGKTALGLLWFAAILVPIYLYKFREYNFEYSRILEVALPTLVTGLLVQLFAFVAFITFGDRE